MIVRKTIDDISYTLDGSLDAAIELLTERKSRYEAEGYTNLQLEIRAYDAWGDAVLEIEITGVREETDEEKGLRLLREESTRQSQRARELQTLADLRAKYGNGE